MHGVKRRCEGKSPAGDGNGDETAGDGRFAFETPLCSEHDPSCILRAALLQISFFRGPQLGRAQHVQAWVVGQEPAWLETLMYGGCRSDRAL